MNLEIFLRYVHFVSVFLIAGSLISEHLLLKPSLKRSEVRKLSRVDAVYGIAALSLLIAGLTLWLGDIGKPSAFYSKNGIFHAKITCFALIGILSIYPTIFFIRNAKGDQDDMVTIPKKIYWMLRIELLLLFIIPLLAGLMAKGVGLYAP